MTIPTVLLDANVLHSTALRSWFFNLASLQTPPPFTLVVTEDIIAEAISTIRNRNPRIDGRVTANIANNLRELCVVQDSFDGSLEFPGNDEGDVHVHAAAVAAEAGYLVTFDKGFHRIDDDLLSYEVYHPDEFLVLANKQSRTRVLDATRENLRYRQIQVERGMTPPTLADALRKVGCPEFANVVTEHLIVLSGESRNGARRRVDALAK